MVLIGGFLGAGKTTMLHALSERFAHDGQKTGLITNDQAAELVDTFYLTRYGKVVKEVSGSCFCCNFNGFIDAARQLVAGAGASVIVAEPVGSCTDLSATILQPLKDQYRGEFELAPLTVLAEPDKLRALLSGAGPDMHKSAQYIYRKQLEEADIIAVSKADLLDDAAITALVRDAKATFPQAQVVAVSAVTGQGLDEWLRLALRPDAAGLHITDVDYDTYAEGEAVLGWLNATLALTGSGVDWDGFLSGFSNALARRISEGGMAVGHLKLILQANGAFAIANLTQRGGEVGIRGQAGRGDAARLTINARVETTPEALDALVRAELECACGADIQCTTDASKVLSPGRPNPTHRYDRAV